MLETIKIRLTRENLDDLHEGDVFTEDRAWGAVKSVRLTRDGYENAMVYVITPDGRESRDVLGLPSTVEIERNV